MGGNKKYVCCLPTIYRQFSLELIISRISLQRHRMVLTDIDGTITTSDVTGFVLPQLGIESHHRDVVEFLDRVSRNGHAVVYLSARPMSLGKTTRGYLFEVRLSPGLSNSS